MGAVQPDLLTRLAQRRHLDRRIAGIALGITAGLAVAGVALAAPDAGFTVSDDTPVTGREVTFTATNPCEFPVLCTWSFGDSGTATGKTVTHAYPVAGEYQAVLVVDDPADLPRLLH